MKEIIFIKQNKEKWLLAEQKIQKQEKISPDILADLYTQLLGDLSFSQTYYPQSKTTIYLNFLVSQIYQKIYKTKRIEQNRFLFFFKEEVPRIVLKHSKTIYFAFALFLFFVVLGVISAKYDPNFIRIVLGDFYVDMTLENIAKGRPMDVYNQGSNWGSAFTITFNNIRVGVYGFLGGFSAGIFTFIVALQNAIMLGSFQYFFYEYNVFAESLRSIWLHGAMEIFAVIIEIGAGFVVAKSILFPQTYSRILSLKMGVKEGLKIVIATMPFTFLAGMIEGFITRLAPKMPLFLNISIIIGTLFFISYYFLIYPLKFKRNE